MGNTNIYMKISEVLKNQITVIGKNVIAIYIDIELLSIYFITVNKYRFCISIIGYIKVQIIGIGYKKIQTGRSLLFSVLDYENDQFEWFSILRELFL